jgi:hypothetical protein
MAAFINLQHTSRVREFYQLTSSTFDAAFSSDRVFFIKVSEFGRSLRIWKL